MTACYGRMVTFRSRWKLNDVRAPRELCALDQLDSIALRLQIRSREVR
jgi:hypothetical protein